jgi:hypothetical protein
MAIKIEYNPDGSIKSAISVNPDGTPSVGTTDTPMPLPNYMYGKGGMMLGTMPKATPGVMTEYDRNRLFGGNFSDAVKAAAQAIRQMENQKFDRITGQAGERTIDDFKEFLKLNKKGFLRDEGQFEGYRGGGLKSFNKLLDDLQEGKIDQLTPEEAKYIDDLKNNRVNL